MNDAKPPWAAAVTLVCVTVTLSLDKPVDVIRYDRWIAVPDPAVTAVHPDGALIEDGADDNARPATQTTLVGVVTAELMQLVLLLALLATVLLPV